MHDFSIYNNQILYAENILCESLDLIELIENTDKLMKSNEAISKWSTWKASGENIFIFGEKKQSDKTYLNQSQDDVKYIYNKIYYSINQAFELYKNNIEKNIGKFNEFGVAKYSTGSRMGKHVDVDPLRENFKETVSGILYLNDNYIGGEIYFENQELFIKPKSGSMVIFPSVPPFFHESKTIEKGIKYICTAFCSL